MRSALVSPDPRIQTVETVTVPAPSGGLNSRDSILAMPPTDARGLLNAIARPGEVEIRPGAIEWATGFLENEADGFVYTLMSYVPSSGAGTLFAASDTTVYDVTVQDTPVEILTGMSSGKWQSVNFANSANQWLIMVNGVNDLQYYDGMTWASTATLGTINTADLVDITVYQKRLFFLEKDSRLVHFLSAGAISGTAQTLNFEQHMKRGGKIQAIGTWSVDAGDGLDDLFVAVTSEGEAIVYAGIDPASADTWALQGVYFIGKPLGQRCLFTIAADLFVATENGLYPLRKALAEGGANERGYLSAKIEKLFQEFSSGNINRFGWQAELSTANNVLVMNVPVQGTQQLILELTTGGWSLFKGWPALCWHTFNNALYFGAENRVAKAFVGNTDFGAGIPSFISPAYLSFGKGTQQKHVKLFRPLWISDLPFTFQAGVAADLEALRQYTTTINTAAGISSLWDTAVWDEATWSGDLLASAWHSVESNPGSFLAIGLKLTKTNTKIRLVGIDYAVARGSLL